MANILVTGGNRGIGLELCRQLSARGDAVTAVCRQSSSELQDLGVDVIDGIDVGRDAAVGKLHGRLGDRRIDVLINNAGILRGEALPDLDWQSIREQYEVNSLGPLRVVCAALDHLVDGGKIALITSRMGSITDNTSGGHYGYRMSKVALNMAGVSLAHDLAPRRIAVAILHPGFVRTEMTGRNGLIDPPDAAEALLARIDSLSMETTGSFWHSNGEALPW